MDSNKELEDDRTQEQSIGRKKVRNSTENM